MTIVTQLTVGWAVLVPITYDVLYKKYIQCDKKISFVVKELIVNLNF